MSEFMSKENVDPAAKARGEALMKFIVDNKLSRTALARAAGISRSALYHLISGERDLAQAETTTAQGLITALGIKDVDAQKLFNIPKNMLPRWSMARETILLPLKHEEAVSVKLVLVHPLSGWVAFPAGTVITINRANKRFGILIIRLSDGTLFASQLSLAPSGAEILGQLTAAEFATVLPDQPQNQGHQQPQN